MNPFFVWLLKSSVSLALLYVVFKLAVSRDKMHTANRFVLLGILLSSVILPFADVPLVPETQVIPQFEVIHEWVAAPAVSEPVIYTEDMSEAMSKATPVKTPFNPWLVLYLAVIGLLVVRLLFSVGRVLQIIHRAEKQNFRDVVLAIVKDFIQPFSFLQHIVLSEKDFTENRDIVVAHEYAHIQHKHALDLMICELFTALFWFNPFMWLLRHDLKLIHEYQADQAVLNKGIDAKTYQLLVLKKAVGERRFAVANHFSQKPILKRIKMMHMKNNRRRTSLKLMLFVPALALLLQAFARPEMIPDKISDLVPSLSVQKDSSEVWLDNWSIQNLSKINNGLETEQYEFAPPPPGSKPSNLPKYEKTKHGNPVSSENIMTILINMKSQILACGSFATVDGVIVGVTKFLNGNPPFEQVKKGPEVITKNLPLVGDVKISKGVIALRYDVETDKAFVDKMLRSIGEIYLEKRQKLAQEKFSQGYFCLSSEKKDVINQILPVRVSIIEPKNIKGIGVRMDQSSELLIPDGFSPNGDGIHDFFEIKGIYPQYPSAKLAVFNRQGQKLFEKQNYGNIDVWGKGKEWWDGTSENGKLSAGYYNYELELGNGEVKKGTLLLARSSSSEQSSWNVKKGSSIGYLNQFDQYDVIITSDKLQVFDKLSTVENVKQEVTESLKSMKNKESISVLSFSDVPKERLDAVLNELNQVPFVKVSATVLKLEQEPASAAQHKILLKANGKIYLDEKEYNLTEFESNIKEISAGKQPVKVTLEVENNTTAMQLETVKRILRNAKVDQVGYSIQSHHVRETEPGTKIGEPVNMFWFGWSGAPNLEKAKRAAENFLSGKGNNSLYAGVTPDKNATQEEIDEVKKVMFDAGFLKVDVRKN